MDQWTHGTGRFFDRSRRKQRKHKKKRQASNMTSRMIKGDTHHITSDCKQNTVHCNYATGAESLRPTLMLSGPSMHRWTCSRIKNPFGPRPDQDFLLVRLYQVNYQVKNSRGKNGQKGHRICAEWCGVTAYCIAILTSPQKTQILDCNCYLCKRRLVKDGSNSVLLIVVKNIDGRIKYIKNMFYIR